MAKGNLPEGYSLRNGIWTDLKAVTQLIFDVCEYEGDTNLATSEEKLREIWEDPKLDMSTDTFIVTDPDGKVVGYEGFNNRSEHANLLGIGYVHPMHLGKGIGTTLLHALDERARIEMSKVAPELRVFIHNTMATGDTIARNMHENEGYKPIRFFWRMEIELNETPPTPVFPEGIELRPFDEAAHAELVYQADDEAYQDHWGYTATDFKEWKRRIIESSTYNPNLWFIAWDGNEIAGYAVNYYKMGNGWVSLLGVRRPWRKLGLGLALLQQSFAAFYARGTKKVSLGVDAANQTGATRLYKRAGMCVASEYVTYEKELRAGREIEE